DLRVADGPAVQHHRCDRRAVRADQCLGEERDARRLPEQQAAPQDAAAGVASWLDGPQLRLALPGRAQLATGIRRGRAPLAEHGQLTAVAGPGQAGHPEVPGPAWRSAPPEGLRASGGVDDDELVGPLRSVQLTAVAVIALVVGPDSQQ